VQEWARLHVRTEARSRSRRSAPGAPFAAGPA